MKQLQLSPEGKMHWAEYTRNACIKIEDNPVTNSMPTFIPVEGKKDFFGILGACGITPDGNKAPAATAAKALETVIAKTKGKYPGVATLPFLVWVTSGGGDVQQKASMYTVLNKALVDTYMPTLINRLALPENREDFLETLESIRAVDSAAVDNGEAAFERDNSFPWSRGRQCDLIWRNRTIGLISDLLRDCTITVKDSTIHPSTENVIAENTFMFLMYLAITVGLVPQLVAYALTNLGMQRYLPNLISGPLRKLMEEQMVLVDGKLNPIIYHYIANVMYDNNVVIRYLLSDKPSEGEYSQALYHLKLIGKSIDERLDAVCDGKTILSVFGFDTDIGTEVPSTVMRMEEFYVKDSLNSTVSQMNNYISLDKLNKIATIKAILAPFQEAQMSSALRVKYSRGIKLVLADIIECAETLNSTQVHVQSLVEALSIASITEMVQKLADIDKNVDVQIQALDMLVKEALWANEEANDVTLQQEPVAAKSESELVAMYEDEIHTLTGRVQDLTTQLQDAQQKLQKAGQLIAEQPTQVAPVVKCDHNLLQRALSDDLRLSEIPDIVKAYFNHVVFLPGSTDELKNSIYKKPAKVLEALIRLCGPYYETLMSGKPDSVAMEIMGNLYRANESGLTMGTPDLRRLREFEVNGKRVEFEQHLDIGTRHGDAYCMQVHFRIIEGVLYIGRMGGHLPVSKLR